MSELFSFDRIHQIDFNLTVGDEVYLHLVLTRSGMVNRRGNGNEADGAMVMGRPEEPIFEQLLAAIPPELFDGAGRYALPEPQGDPSELRLSFTGPDLDTGFAFQYGSESMGPPDEFVELVELALELTEDWYQSKRPGQR